MQVPGPHGPVGSLATIFPFFTFFFDVSPDTSEKFEKHSSVESPEKIKK